MTVRTCDCGTVVYELAAAGVHTPGTVRLDTTDHPDGDWVPDFDGRTAHRLTEVDTAAGNRGHRVHDCHRPLDGQAELFGAGQ